MQAPIGPASTPELVAAVSQTGALGTLAASWTPLERLREQIRRVRSMSDRPFCVNLVLAFEQAERLDLVLDEGVPIVSFSWGIDGELMRRARERGATVLVQVGDPESAIAAAEAGADVVIVQGVEAGGHVQGRTPLLELVGSIRERVDLPLVAAGGIGDASAGAAAMAAGADGFACGTVFLAAEEADVHPAYVDALIRAGAADTELTGVFDRGWDAPHRVLRNSTLRDWEASGRPAAGARPGEGEVVGNRGGHAIPRYSEAQPTSRTEGDAEAMALYAGTSAAAVTAREPAAAIVRRLLA
jgi:NAD(P)H-dependent flavin oxidoreductase YrpB (nitropropane dioxygenase family)